MSNGAPVCNLPNLGQVPARQAGRLFSSIPRAQDLPSLINAINAMAQLVARLLAPGTPPFQNNLAPFNTASQLVGTAGINSGAGADGSAGAKGKDGQKGEDAKQPNWRLAGVETELVKVMNPDDHDQFVVVKRIKSIEFDDEHTNNVLLLTMRPQ